MTQAGGWTVRRLLVLGTVAGDVAFLAALVAGATAAAAASAESGGAILVQQSSQIENKETNIRDKNRTKALAFETPFKRRFLVLALDNPRHLHVEVSKLETRFNRDFHIRDTYATNP